VPNSDRLDLDAAGIRTDDRGYIDVDDRLRTSVEGVYALGDVNGQGAFTHTSVNDAEIVLDALRGGTRRLSDRIPTYAVFIDPPLGRVGMTEKEALAKGHRVMKAVRPMSSISRAREMGETQGFVKLLVDADDDMILGASILGVGGDEVINMFAAFMYSGQPCHRYRRAVLVHPTVSELMPWILDGLEPVG
jgi:pyruvate/2-oxoglutarate dehydrogenase complex dihydrolipoamide dehydrogenase (E3) component